VCETVTVVYMSHETSKCEVENAMQVPQRDISPERLICLTLSTVNIGFLVMQTQVLHIHTLTSFHREFLLLPKCTPSLNLDVCAC